MVVEARLMPETMPDDQKPILLSAAGLACRRGDRVLFAGLDFELSGGGLILVEGPNGVGKSSLLRLCAGLLRPASGRVDAHAGMALCDQHLALDEDRSLIDAMTFWSGSSGREGAIAALEKFNLAELAEVPVGYLSTGQRQRSRLARSSLGDEKIWLLDEPVNGLDKASVEMVLTVIAEHRRAGGAVLMTSHIDLDLNPDRVIALGEYRS